jgi:hypothetical protein
MSRGKHGTFTKRPPSEPTEATPTRHLGAELPPEAVASIAALARANGVKQRALMIEAVILLLEDHCEPVPPALRRALAKYNLG